MKCFQSEDVNMYVEVILCLYKFDSQLVVDLLIQQSTISNSIFYGYENLWATTNIPLVKVKYFRKYPINDTLINFG